MLVISRAEAKSQGLKKFFTSRPCKEGHIGERYVANSQCVECNTNQAVAYQKTEQHKTVRAGAKYQAMRANFNSRYCKTDKKKQYTKNWKLVSQYGITLSEFRDMLVAQNGACKICGVTMVEGGVSNISACLDHCHASGKVRGILCSACNKMLGMARDSTNTLQKAIDYLLANQ